MLLGPGWPGSEQSRTCSAPSRRARRVQILRPGRRGILKKVKHQEKYANKNSATSMGHRIGNIFD